MMADPGRRGRAPALLAAMLSAALLSAAQEAAPGTCKATPGEEGACAADANNSDVARLQAMRRAVVSGDAAMQARQFATAAKHFGTAIDLGPNDASAYAKRATALVSMGKPYDALRDLDRAVAVDTSGSALTRLPRARVRRMLCQFEGALEDLRAVLELSPQNDGAAKELSTSLEARRALGLARLAALASADRGTLDRHVDAVLERCNACAPVRMIRAERLLKDGDPDSAVAECGHILKANGKDLEALLLRGRAYYAVGKVDLSLKHFREGLKFDPEHSALKKAYRVYKGVEKAMEKGDAAAAESRHGDAAEAFEKANAEMSKAAAADGTRAPPALAARAHFGACKAHRRAGRGEKAAGACSSAIASHGEGGTAEMLLERAEAFMMQEDWDRAMHDAQQAHHKDSGIGANHAYQRAQQGKRNAGRVDYYKVLGVVRGASDREIRRAYKAQALKWHPDKNAGNEEEAEKQFQKVAEAYEILTDPEKKRRYDRGEDVTGNGGGQPQHHHHHHFHHRQHFQQHQRAHQRTFHFNFG